MQRYQSLNIKDFEGNKPVQKVTAKVSSQNRSDQNNDNKEIEKLRNENRELKEKIELLTKENQKLKKENENFDIKLDLIKNGEIKKIEEKYKMLINEKEKIIDQLKSKISNSVVEPKIAASSLLDEEKLVTVNFISVDQNISYTVTCNSNTEFHNLESQLYKKYPEYKKSENYFVFKGNKVNRFDTLRDIGIIEYVVMLNTIQE